MSDLRIDLHEVEQFLKTLDGAGQRIAAPAARRYMQMSVDTVEAEVVGRTPVNTGALRSSITQDVRGHALNLRGEIMTDIIYGLPVERGRKPGKMPPVDAIEYWVIRKGLAEPGSDSRSAAFLIARAIGRHGTKGAHMFEEGLKAAEPKVEHLWRGLPGDIVRELAR